LAIIKNANISFLNKVIFIDNEERIISALNQRISKLHNGNKILAVKGDYNNLSSIKNILNSLPSDNLNLVFAKVKNKYESFLGRNDFFLNSDNILLAEQGKNRELKEKFMRFYEKSFEQLGYIYKAHEPVLHYYHLLFVSKNQRGLDFWRKANIFDPDGQKTFNF